MDHPSFDDDREYEIGIQISRETMTGDVRDVILAEIKHAKLGAVPWAKMTEAQQRTLIDRCTRFGDDLVARVARIVAADGRMVINGEVDKVDVKDSKDGALLQARFVTHRSEGSLTSLGMAVGKTVSMLIQDIQPFRGERAPAAPDPDQPQLDFTQADYGDDGMTFNKGEALELPDLVEKKTPQVRLTCALGKRVRFAAVQFGAHSMAIGLPVEGNVSAQHEDESDPNRVTSGIFAAPETSELQGVDFGVALLDDQGNSTANIQIVISYAEAAAPAATEGDPEPQPEDGGDTGAAGDEDPQPEGGGDTEDETQATGEGEPPAAGEEEQGPSADLAGETPPPKKRGIPRARGRRGTTH